MANRVDGFIYDEAFALFLCASRTLYAATTYVDFTASRTTFELPDCQARNGHWSRRPR